LGGEQILPLRRRECLLRTTLWTAERFRDPHLSRRSPRGPHRGGGSQPSFRRSGSCRQSAVRTVPILGAKRTIDNELAAGGRVLLRSSAHARRRQEIPAKDPTQRLGPHSLSTLAG